MDSGRIPERIKGYTLHRGELAHKAYYYLQRFGNHKIIIVTDDDGTAIGILTPGDFSMLEVQQWGNAYRGYDWLDDKTVGDICNRHFKFITAEEDKYRVSRNIFAEAGLKIMDIPILNGNGILVDIIARWQAFYKEFYETGRLLRMNYAEPIMKAARLAASRGYNSISVIEFGVAGGTGLVLAELYARETARLTGVDISVYGFDLGTGLPELGERDLRSMFVAGDYLMDYEKLKKQLISAELIIGDIRDTAKDFIKKYNPPPIGVMLVDVDIYSSTVPILEMLLEDDAYFLPIVHLYFDDIFATSEFEGEWLAVKEFNNKNRDIKIAPEGYSINIDQIDGGIPFWRYRSKCCYRYSHPKLTVNRPDIVAQLELNL